MYFVPPADGLGLSAFGIDLSPQMVAVARRSYPALRFEVGSMLDLDLQDGALGGILAWYSTIHIPEERPPDVFAEYFQPRQPDPVARLLCAAGFVMRARMLREPDEDGEFTERTQQAFLLARKPSVAPHVT